MTVNEIITGALKPFGDPVCFGEYIPKNEKARREKYYTFNYFKRPINFADDAPGFEHYFIQVHFYCPASHNSLQQVWETQDALFAADFTWPEVTFDAYSDGQHVVFEFEYAEAVNNGDADN